MDSHYREGHGHKSKHHHYHHHHHHHHKDRERDRHQPRHHHRHRRESHEARESFSAAASESAASALHPQPPPPIPAPPLQHVSSQSVPIKEKHFKLIVDPALVKGATKKVYRFDGVVPGEPSWNVVGVKDPRPMIPRRWTRPETIDLPVPRFKIDKNYVGEPPELEVTITNLNDNIDKAFLSDLVSKYGDLEEVTIFYHPVTRKHTGIARVVYTEVPCAATCVAALHNRSVMGKLLIAFVDPLAKEWLKCIQKITNPDLEVKNEENIPVDPEPIPPITAISDSKDKAVAPKCEDTQTEKKRVIVPPPVIDPPTPIFNVPPPIFTRPPPMAQAPSSVAPTWQQHRDWPETNVQWNQPPPPQWAPPPPQFMSPPPSLPPQPQQPPPPADESPLDLDTRIELLLKGGINGVAPPFLALDDVSASEEVNEPVAQTRSGSVSSEERYSPPPLPPGVDASPSYSPTAPLPSTCEYSSDKYLPLSIPPSPFLSEEEYLECLLKWRIRHLSFVQQEEEEEKKKNKLVSDKVSEISSEEDETVFNKNDDQMSLSSLSSVNENIEEVSIPTNPYGSYHCGEGSSFPHPPPNLHHSTLPVEASHLQPGMWPQPPFYQGPGQMYPLFDGVTSQMNLPIYHNEQYPHYETSVQEEPAKEKDLLSRTVDLALDRVCELMTATLERDIMKRMTEVLAFNEFEKWWETEEKKYFEEKKEPDREKDLAKDDTEEKKSTTDALLNAIIDSNLDSLSSGFTLGFRAALPKMPSFRRKQIMPTPGRDDVRSKFNKNNESDDEEMVKLSDSESEEELEPDSMSRKRLESVSSDSLSSDTLESSDTDLSDAESTASDDNLREATDQFLMLIDDEKLEELRSKTPEERLTPLPSDDFSDMDDSDSGSQSSSASGSRDLKRYAMEALAALGLDEFVESVKIREREKIKKPKEREPAPLKVPTFPKKIANESFIHPSEPSTSKIQVADEPQSKKEQPVPLIKPVKDVNMDEEMEEGEIRAEVSEPLKAVEEVAPAVTLISVEHSYSRPEGSKIESREQKPSVDSWMLDHAYSGPQPSTEAAPSIPVHDNAAVKSTTKERKKKSEKLVSHLLDSYLPREIRVNKTYTKRDPLKEMMTCYEFLTKGVDQEDIKYFKKAFEVMLSDESQSYWLNNMHWAAHPSTDLGRPSGKRSKGHQSGCARTQGFYKLDPMEKQKLKHHFSRNRLPESQALSEAKVWTSAGREARSHQRRLLTAFGADTDSDLLKFNQLKFRKKFLKFGKSEIHDWGLFAKEPIAADEMVIEYVGQKVRPFLADYREIKYQKRGIGSSYLFRIDTEHIVDATNYGNLARFINHSCNPNCYAKIITIESDKKIVIYSKRDIKVDEEITYDYKFPLEEEKISCLCGDVQCKGFLN